MPPNNADVLLRLLLEDKFSPGLDKALAHLEERIKKASSVKELESLERQFNEITQAIDETNKAAAAAQATLLKTQTTSLALEKARIGALNTAASTIGSISQSALFGGTGLIGGVFGFASKYVKNAEEATEVTRQWEAAQESLRRSGERTGAVFAEEALPMLEQAARLASKAAGFIESNPEIVQAALQTGKILVGLSVLGTLASKGIKLVADIRFLATIPAQVTAAKLQDQAANKQLEAALLRAKDVGIPLPGKGTSLLGLGPLAGILSGAALFGTIGTKASQVGAGLFGTTPAKFWEDLAAKMGITLPKIKDLTNRILNFGEAVEEAEQKASNAITGLAGSENEKAVVSAFTKWKEEDRRLIEEAADNRRKIIADAERSIANATRQYAQQRLDINKKFDEARADLIKNFAESSKQAEIDYAKARADVVKDAGEEVRRIEEQHQENIRQMTLEHNQRVEDLTASRDALGLAKEQERFDQDRAEAERQTNQEIAQRRRETAVRLQELAAEFAAERIQRQAEFEQALADNQARRQEELQEAALAHAEELRQIREQRATQLRELQQSLDAERLRRREVFIAEVRDLDAALLGERNLKNQYYNLMLSDAEAWLAAYRAKLSVGATGSRAGGGYATYGLYRLGDTSSGGRGGAEFVLSSSTTRAAEQVIGGQLSQRALLNALMMGGRGQITLNDHRRFDSRLSLADRRAIQEDTLQVLGQVLG